MESNHLLAMVTTQNERHGVRLTHVLIVIAGLANATASAQESTIHVASRYIIGPCGDTLTLKGVNYAPYNWGWSPDESRIAEIATTGANCVRLPWYVNTPDGATPQATYDDLTKLDNSLAECIAQDMIPILELHDQTCANDPASLIALADWYTQPEVLALINTYHQDMIIDVANEALFVGFTGDPAAAQSSFITTYTTIISNMRNAGIIVPIMIDGPDCGTNLDVLADVGAGLELADPLGNLIFSAHGYWYAFAGNDPLQMQQKVDHALDMGIPFIFGEVANQQDDATMCQYTLDYASLLAICTTEHIGWLAWSWDHDGCPERQITTNGLASSLTTYGDDIVNNATYGLMANTVRSAHLVNDGCSGMGVDETTAADVGWSVVIDPNRHRIEVMGHAAFFTAQLLDLYGRIVPTVENVGYSFTYGNLPPGIYVFTASAENGQRVVRKLAVQ